MEGVLETEREKNIGWFFNLALILKLVNGALEVLAAAIVLIIPPALVMKVVQYITGGELAQDVDDPISSALLKAAHAFTVHTHYFLSIYLALHGAVKIFLVIGIFKKKKIAYPLFMVALSIFGIYEVYRGFVRHELLLEVIGALDFFLLILTAYEYRRRYPLPSVSDTPTNYVAK